MNFVASFLNTAALYLTTTERPLEIAATYARSKRTMEPPRFRTCAGDNTASAWRLSLELPLSENLVRPMMNSLGNAMGSNYLYGVSRERK